MSEIYWIVLSVTTASDERSFSTLKMLKTYIQSKTGEERLTALALMTVHKDIGVEKKKLQLSFLKVQEEKDFFENKK